MKSTIYKLNLKNRVYRRYYDDKIFGKEYIKCQKIMQKI